MGDLEMLREQVTVAELVPQTTVLKKLGTRLVGHCPLPAHDDSSPSFTVFPDTRSFYCFGCGIGGDVFDLLMVLEGLAFPEAVRRVATLAGMPSVEFREDPERVTQLKTLERTVFNACTELTHHHREYLSERGLNEDTILRLRIGSLTPDEILLPVLRYGKPVYSIRHLPGAKERKYRFPKGEPRPLLGEELLHSGRSVVVGEGYFDWASLTQIGLDAVGLLGTGKNGDAEKLGRADRVYLALDGDEAGRRAARRILPALYPKARLIQLPDGEDPADFILRHGEEAREAFEGLMIEAPDALEVALNTIAATGTPEDLKQLYPLLAIHKGPTDLDLAIHRVSVLTKQMGVRKQTIRDEVERTRSLAEAEDTRSAQMKTEVSPEVDSDAQALLEDPDILERMIHATNTLGHLGEIENRKMAFLSAVAGHTAESHEDAIHLVVKGDSASGKNELLRCVLSLVPEGRVRFLTGVSQQALVYTGGRIEGVLVFQEAEGEDTAEYMVRQAMSEGHLERITVVDGEPRTLRTYVCGSVFTTTTGVSLHDENQTRVFDLHTDEGAALTRRVIDSVAEIWRGAGSSTSVQEHTLEVWRTAISLLRPTKVAIPYAPQIAERFPDGKVRARRDIKRVFNLIRASAVLHQRTRPAGPENRLEAAVDDYRMVYPLIQRVLGPSMSGLTEKALKIAELANGVPKDSGWFHRTDLQEAAQKGGVASEKTVRDWGKRFGRTGLWEERMEKGRIQYRVLRNPEEEPISLPTPDELIGLVVPGRTTGTSQESNNHAGYDGTGKPATGEGPPPPSPHAEARQIEAEFPTTATTSQSEVVEGQGDLFGNAPLPPGNQDDSRTEESGREVTVI